MIMEYTIMEYTLLINSEALIYIFSDKFRIKRKTVNDVAEKSSRYISIKFTLNLKILALLLLMGKITQIQKNGKKYLYGF
jgi:hypothetical protein